MDPVLAEIYGTNRESDQTDVEKLAAAEMAEQLAENDELNVDGLTQEQIEELAQSVLDGVEGAGETQATETKAAEPTEAAAEDDEEEVLAKVAMFDKLGRVMAHSMWQELGSIQKEAAKSTEQKGGAGISRHERKVPHGPNKPSMASRAGDVAKDVGEKARYTANRAGAALKDSKVGKHLAGNKGKYMAGAAGALALGAGAKKMFGKKKESSALDTLAEQRALEILQASGIDPAALTPVNQEKVAAEVDSNEVLENAVQARAWEMLAQYGVEPAAVEQE